MASMLRACARVLNTRALRALACLAALTVATSLPAADPVRDDDRDTAPADVVNVATCSALPERSQAFG